MSERPSFSTLRSSVSLARESQVEQLAKKLQKAVGHTVEDVPKTDRHSRRFLPKTDLDQILTYKSLDLLFRELVCIRSSSGVDDISQAITSDAADERDGTSPTCVDETIEKYISATTGTPSRTSLLALFLYQDRLELLLLFLAWLTSEIGRPEADLNRFIPSDVSMPFTEIELFEHRVPDRYHASILEEQAVFKPRTIRKLQHHNISSSERLPFVGKQESIKSGSQGQVVRAVISQRHWEIQEDEAQKETNFVPGNPNSTKIVALKIFKAVERVRAMDEATEDFDIELKILKELRKHKTKHEMIMLHLGSITELDEVGSPIRHALIFELANYSLDDLLKDRNRAQKELLPSRLLGSLVDIIEALECLHNKLDTFHLDIKPDNILIFETHSGSGSRNQYELTWKLSDFGLAGKKAAKKRRTGSAQTSTATSRGSTLPATRPTGLYQAPEIQEPETSLAGQGSDVWSMGCVTLMVLAFIADGSMAVRELETLLMVNFSGGAGREPLFYIGSDSYLWENRTAHICCYLPDKNPDVGIIPHTGEKLRAALHPLLIYWSNTLLRATYYRRIEQRFVLDLLRLIFGRVLRIDRNKRIGATELRSGLDDIQQDWKAYDLAPGDYDNRDIAEVLNLPQSRSSSPSHSTAMTQRRPRDDEPTTPPAFYTTHTREDTLRKREVSHLQEPPQSRPSQEHETSHQVQPDESLTQRVPDARPGISGTIILPTYITNVSNTRQDDLHNTLREESIQVQDPTAPTQDPAVAIPDEQVQAQTGTTAPTERGAVQDEQEPIQEQTTQPQEELCSAIERDDADRVRLLLRQNPELLGQLCLRVERYPIQWALFKNAHNALDELFANASPDIIKKEYSGRTALEIALSSGKPAALDRIWKYRSKFDFPRELYERHKKDLGWEAKGIADDLFGIKKPRESRLMVKWFQRGKTSNSPA
ncbi:uncharacterized protein J4E92_003945 [Alternaria infectoria]|uniref:uncharacterized protein n=1 Tax=Alternaria infectoria TaxID=45303 RepID=UPI0022204DED|nr:uncharacterized protein J4E92_003945 [Alternaria infectoria]KAI4932046.1 hypothetical protein J4E92_003945 [Alternaria infectoria]